MQATPSEIFSFFASSTRRATEALSQAETLCGQFSASSRRGYVNNATGDNGEAQIAKIEDAFSRCLEHCQESRNSSLWSVTSMEILQSLSPLQRQRLASMRSEIEDVERQVRILQTRHSVNAQKFYSQHQQQQQQQYQGSNNNSQFSSSPTSTNHVASVLERSSQQKQQQQQQQKDLTAEEYKKREQEDLKRVVGGVRQLVAENNAVLGALRQQRSRMSETDSKLGQVLSSAGVAQSVVKQLERMTLVDKVIVFGGILFISAFMFYLWFFV